MNPRHLDTPSRIPTRPAGNVAGRDTQTFMILAMLRSTLRILLLLSWFALPAIAAPQASGDDKPADDKKDAKKPRVEEAVVVSASTSRGARIDAPAAVDVLEGETLEQTPGDILADYLRRVPGVNVVQFSVRDVNVASRSATGGINNSTLALADGRNLYQDFLGFVLWEFAPTDFSIVDRVEVVRGPASAIWGANAVGGVVHVITRSPRDTPGGRLVAEAGDYDTRRIEARQSFPAGDWDLRVSGSYYEAEAFARPQTITNFLGETIDPDLGLIDESFVNSATEQPRFDLRADRRTDRGGEWILQGGWGGTQGWIATGLGPFQIGSGTDSSFLQARYRQGLYEGQVDVTHFDGDAINLINGLPFAFTSTTANGSFRGQHVLGDRGVLGFGAEAGRSDYDLSIAPDADHRTRGALFAEVDYRLASRWWALAGGRVDHIREIVGSVFSPRAALRFKPTPDQTIRLAWGEAFRAPSVIETDLLVPSIPVAILDWEELDEEVVGFPFFDPLAQVVCSMEPDNCGAPPGEAPDYIAVTRAEGNRDLDEETTSSVELGYAARLGAFELAATVYRTRSERGIDFPLLASYGNGPDGLPGTVDDIVLPTDPDGDGIDEAPPTDVCPYLSAIPPFNELCLQGPIAYNHALSILLDGQVPSLFRYENSATARDRGIELGTTWFAPAGVTLSCNYTWQDDPVADGVPMRERIETVRQEIESDMDIDGDGEIGNTRSWVNIPAEHRVSLSAQIERPRWFAGVSWDWVDETFWQDVLTSDFWGWVPSYSLVGLRAGWRSDSGFGVTGQVTNLLDEPIQQHILGDIIERRATLSVEWSWGDR